MPHHTLLVLALGVALDFAIGDPRGWPHLVKAVAWLAQRVEGFLERALGRSIFAGLIFWILVVGALAVAYLALAALCSAIHPWLRVALDAVIVHQTIAYNDLVKHVRAVKIGLARSLEEGRRRVSWIVGRDTDRMDESDVCRAAIESGSENLNDAVIAPLFWIVVAGPLGGLVFRISNTLDAMVGYRDARYERFGKVSARIDDALNFLPARLCSLLTLRLSDWQNWPSLASDSRKHPSPNAGWPEAAMARRLGVVIGGAMYKNGKLVQTAQMNEGARQPKPLDLERATRVMLRAYAKALLLAAIALALLAL